MGQRRSARRLGLFAAIVGGALAIGTGPATAAVTIGQLAPNPVAATCTVSPYDDVTVSVGSGNSYAMPANGTVVSWTTNAGPAAGQQLKMKIYRRVSEFKFQVVGHDGPRMLTPGGTAGNTFSASIPVKKGDLLGLNDGNASGGTPNACQFPLPGSALYESQTATDTPDGGQADFVGPYAYASNVTAVLAPDNNLTIGAITRKKNGSAIVNLTSPNAGLLATSVSGGKATLAKKKAKPPKPLAVPEGGVRVKVKATGRKRAHLNETGKVTLKVTFAYTPTGGDAKSQTLKVKLRKG